jgi:hypothetical protein
LSIGLQGNLNLASFLNMRRYITTGLVLLLGIVARGSGAVSIYATPWTGTWNGASSVVAGQEVAEFFVLTQTASANYITWSGIDSGSSYLGTTTSLFEIRFYTNDYNGRPTTTPFYAKSVNANVNSTADSFSNYKKIDFSAYLPDVVTFNGGEGYWISILGTNARIGFDWMTGDTGGTVDFRPYPGGTNSLWRPTNLNTSVVFGISSIPEPSSLSLLLIGLAGVAYRRLLKRRS